MPKKALGKGLKSLFKDNEINTTRSKSTIMFNRNDIVRDLEKLEYLISGVETNAKDKVAVEIDRLLKKYRS